LIDICGIGFLSFALAAGVRDASRLGFLARFTLAQRLPARRHDLRAPDRFHFQIRDGPQAANHVVEIHGVVAAVAHVAHAVTGNAHTALAERNKRLDGERLKSFSHP
jgi:hypothetical protein